MIGERRWHWATGPLGGDVDVCGGDGAFARLTDTRSAVTTSCNRVEVVESENPPLQPC